MQIRSALGQLSISGRGELVDAAEGDIEPGGNRPIIDLSTVLLPEIVLNDLGSKGEGNVLDGKQRLLIGDG